MANYGILKNAIQNNYEWDNGENKIEGPDVEQCLLALIDSLGANYQYAGIAKLTPTPTDPGTPDQNVFYIPTESGTYANFNGLVVEDGEVAIFKYNGTWQKDSTGAATAIDVSRAFTEILKLNSILGTGVDIISTDASEWEQGTLSSSGQEVDTNVRVRSKKTFLIPAGLTLYLDFPSTQSVMLCYWDMSGVYHNTAWMTEHSYTFQEDVNVRFLLKNNDGTDIAPSSVLVSVSVSSDSMQGQIDSIVSEVGEYETLFDTGANETYVNKTRNANTGEIVNQEVLTRVTTTKEVAVNAGRVIQINVPNGQWVAVNYFVGTTYVDNGWTKVTTKRVIENDCRIVILGRNADNSNINPVDFACSVVLLPAEGTILEQMDTLQSEVETFAIPQKEMNNKCIGYMATAFHRGARDVCPENTLPAFARTKELGAAMFETDVQFTSDNVPVIIHDTTIDRTARDSEGQTVTGNVADLTYQQLLQYDFGRYKSADYIGTKIPTLAQTCDLLRALDLEMILEIKVAITDAQAKIIVDTIDYYGMLDKVIFLRGNSISDLNLILKYHPSARVMYGLFNTDLTDTILNNIKSLQNGRNSVCVQIYNYNTITAEKVAALQGAGIRVYLGVVPESEFATMNPYVSGVLTEAPNDYAKYIADHYLDLIV